MLEPNPLNHSLEIYPKYEHDFALGQSGSQKNITTPKNYDDTNVTDELVANAMLMAIITLTFHFRKVIL
jgi:hypothetical protein